jgi:Na+/pantothenate symporter
MTPVVECLVAFLFGSVAGLLMQRSRFCNTAALRDAIMFKTYRNTKAMLVAMMILTIGFTGFMSVGAGHPLQFDVGLNTFAGLFLFGIGMVLAGPARCPPGSRRARAISARCGR